MGDAEVIGLGTARRVVVAVARIARRDGIRTYRVGRRGSETLGTGNGERRGATTRASREAAGRGGFDHETAGGRHAAGRPGRGGCNQRSVAGAVALGGGTAICIAPRGGLEIDRLPQRAPAGGV